MSRGQAMSAEPARMKGPEAANAPGPRGTRRSSGSDVVVQVELVRVRSQPHRVELVEPLVLDPGVDDVLGEDASLQQELVVGLQCVEDLLQ